MVKLRKIIEISIVLNLLLEVVAASSKNVALQRVAARKEQAIQHHLERISPRVGRSFDQEKRWPISNFASVASQPSLLGSADLESVSSVGETIQRDSVSSATSDHLNETAVPNMPVVEAELLDVPAIPEIVGASDILVDPLVLDLSEHPSASIRIAKSHVVEQDYNDQDVTPNPLVMPIDELALSAVNSEPLMSDLVLSDADLESLDDDTFAVTSIKNDIVRGYQAFIEDKPLSWLEDEKQHLILRKKELASLFHEKISDESLVGEQRMQMLSDIGILRQFNSVFLQATQDLIAKKVAQQNIKDLKIKLLQEKQKPFERRSFLDKFMSGTTLSY